MIYIYSVQYCENVDIGLHTVLAPKRVSTEVGRAPCGLQSSTPPAGPEVHHANVFPETLVLKRSYRHYAPRMFNVGSRRY